MTASPLPRSGNVPPSPRALPGTHVCPARSGKGLLGPMARPQVLGICGERSLLQLPSCTKPLFRGHGNLLLHVPPTSLLMSLRDTNDPLHCISRTHGPRGTIIVERPCRFTPRGHQRRSPARSFRTKRGSSVGLGRFELPTSRLSGVGGRKRNVKNAKGLGVTVTVPFPSFVFNASEVREFHGRAAPGRRPFVKRKGILPYPRVRRVPSDHGSSSKPS